MRRQAGWDGFFGFLEAFDGEIARHARPIPADVLAQRLFKVEGDATLYEPFFQREAAAIGGDIRAAGNAPPPSDV